MHRRVQKHHRLLHQNVAVDMRGGNVCSNTYALNTVTMQKIHTFPSPIVIVIAMSANSRHHHISKHSCSSARRGRVVPVSVTRYTPLVTRHTQRVERSTLHARHYTTHVTHHTTQITQIIDSAAAEAVVGKGGGVLFLCG